MKDRINFLSFVGIVGLEPTTSNLSGSLSNQLIYMPIFTPREVNSTYTLPNISHLNTFSNVGLVVSSPSKHYSSCGDITSTHLFLL